MLVLISKKDCHKREHFNAVEQSPVNDGDIHEDQYRPVNSVVLIYRYSLVYPVVAEYKWSSTRDYHSSIEGPELFGKLGS